MSTDSKRPAEGRTTTPERRALPRSVRWLVIAGLSIVALVVVTRTMDRRSAEAAASELHDVLGQKFLSSYVRKVDGSNNAAHWLEAAGGALIGVGELGDQMAALESSASCAELEASKLAGILDQNRQALEMAHLARDTTESSYGIDYRRGHAADIPNLTTQLQLSRLLVLGGRLHLCRGDVESAIESTRTLRRLRDALTSEPMPIFRLLGVAIGNRYLWLARQWLMLDDAPTDFLEELAATSPPYDLQALIDETLSLEALVAMTLPTEAFGPQPEPLIDPRSWLQPQRHKTRSLIVQRERLESLRASDELDLSALEIADTWFEASHLGDRMALDHARRQLLRAAAKMRLGEQPEEVSQPNAFTKQPLRVEFTATPPSIVIPDAEEQAPHPGSHLRQVTSLPIAPAFE